MRLWDGVAQFKGFYHSGHREIRTDGLDFRGATLQDSSMALEFTTSYLKDATDLFRYYKRLGDRAMEQTPDEALAATLDEESNSIAIIVKHLTGNVRSRWTDFLTSDGEKPRPEP